MTAQKELYPLKLGNQWTYEVKAVESSYEYTDEVIEEKVLLGKTYYHLDDGNAWDYYRNTEDGKVEIVTYEEGMIEPMISGNMITTPLESFESGVVNGVDTDGTPLTGKVFTKAEKENAVINGFQVTLRIEEVFMRSDNTIWRKQVSLWGNGIGIIRSELYVSEGIEKALRLSSASTLKKVNFK